MSRSSIKSTPLLLSASGSTHRRSHRHIAQLYSEMSTSVSNDSAASGLPCALAQSCDALWLSRRRRISCVSTYPDDAL